MPAETKNKVKSELEKGTAISIVTLVNSLIEEAGDRHASDIHVVPEAQMTRVRYRIDGILEDAHQYPLPLNQSVISRIKVLAGLRTDEHQAAQDGRFSLAHGGITADIRVSIVPTYHGENAVLRILSDKAENFTLEALGFSESDRRKIQKAIKRPVGMILSTGPTGSGKTTTLYTIIKLLNNKETSIVTIEDPIEYSIGGITQIQVNQRSGLTFANGLRSILRQDPNVIMVGEIRDLETAAIAVNTSLTGHLLLSTLHTTDAATTLPRLLDMKVEPFLVASTFNVGLGQRLVRRICEHCRKERPLKPTEKEGLADALPESLVVPINSVWFGAGCEKCHASGYSGRVGINEVMLADQDIREAILLKASAKEIKRIAVQNGMTTMLEDGIEKAKAGMTTYEEVLRVIRD
ncbi:MAG: type II/IV secretion system protein [Candidatus Taylorbacteria bacterium]|nr:type II/IV secretion system protein [Candidatus Taylorbacteria bacterium]